MTLHRREFMTTAAGWLALGSQATRVTGDDARLLDPAREVPWLDEIQTPPEKLPDDAPELTRLLIDDDGREITELNGWKQRRKDLLAVWREFLKPLALERETPRLETLAEDRTEGVVRRLVKYETGPGLVAEGYLLMPEGMDGDDAEPHALPGVVALHSTVEHTIRQPAGLEGDSAQAFGLKLARKGFVAFCPRCFLWVGEGDYHERVARFQKRHPGRLGMAKMLWDAQRGLDALESLAVVDGSRLGAVGHSLGAKEALYLAAFDERVKVAVSSEGGIGTKFSNWDASWYLGQAIKDGTFTREHHELLALVAPRPFLLLGGDSADGARSWPFIEAALPVYRLYGEPPRIGLFNHRRGHAVPPEAKRRIEAWFEAYL